MRSVFSANLFGEFCDVILTGEVQRPRLPLVVIETGIVATLHLGAIVTAAVTTDHLSYIHVRVQCLHMSLA